MEPEEEMMPPATSIIDDYADKMAAIPSISEAELAVLMGQDDTGAAGVLGPMMEAGMAPGEGEMSLMGEQEAMSEIGGEDEAELRMISRDLLLKRAKERQKRSDEFQLNAAEMRNRKL